MASTNAHVPYRRADRPKIRPIVLPTEHGGWGFTLEPILLGLLVAPSASAWGISAAAISIFLARRPFKIFSSDLVRRRWLPRTTISLLASLIFVTIAVAGTIGAFVTAQRSFWIPVFMAIPFVLIALRADARSRNHTLVAEVSGAIAMGATVAAITVSSGWDLAPSLGLWLVLAARDLAAIVLVRGQLRRTKGKQVDVGTIYVVQAVSVAAIAIAAIAGIVPWLSVAAVGLVGVVALVSLNRPPQPAKVIGWTQMVVGVTVVLLTAFGVHIG